MQERPAHMPAKARHPRFLGPKSPCLGNVKTRTNLNDESLVGPGFIDTKIKQASSFNISVICRGHTFLHKTSQRESNKGFALTVLFLPSV